MKTAERIVRVAGRWAPRRLQGWVDAMSAEVATIEGRPAALMFALGCAAWAAREAMAQAFRDALPPHDEHSPGGRPMTIQDGLKARGVALACAVAATALGLVYLAEAGAPTRLLTVNAAALVAGLVMVLPFARRNPMDRPFVGVVAVAIGLALLLTAGLGSEVSGASRWVSVGGVVLQPSLIGVPFLVVGFARSRDPLTALGVVLAAAALAWQPDRAMAAALIAGVGAVAVIKRERAVLTVLVLALAGLAIAFAQPDVVPATPYVDRVFRTAASTSALAGLAVWSGAILLLVPALLGLTRDPANRAVHAAAGASWLAILTAAVVGDYPTPVVAYGGSAIVGYLLMTLALPRPGVTAAEKHTPEARSTRTEDTPALRSASPRLRSGIRAALPSLLLALAVTVTGCGPASETDGTAAAVDAPTATPKVSTPRVEVPKVEREGVWQPGPGGTQVPLWPADVLLAKPDSGDRPEMTGNGSPTVGGRKWHWATYVTRPTMTVYRPQGRNPGAAMLVLPGGGFHAVAMDLEGTEICDWVVRQGMTCVVLKYRTPQVWPTVNGRQRRPDVLLGLEDAQRAMTLLRERAADYGIDPKKIGVIGFSAGAYLVANISNTDERTYQATDAADRQSSRPDFAIVAYTARMLDDSGGRNDLQLQPWVTISPNAPPTLIIHAMDDPVDDIRQPMAYALALNDAGVPVDLRLYARGGHAFGMRPTTDPITTDWPGQVKSWMVSIGML
jgi:acetyl esterase/lipase